jgi:hypothetical protein
MFLGTLTRSSAIWFCFDVRRDPAEDYVDTMESLPAELARNFTLIKELDSLSHGVSGTRIAKEERVITVSVAPRCRGTRADRHGPNLGKSPGDGHRRTDPVAAKADKGL